MSDLSRLTKVTVNLTPKGVAAMESLSEETGTTSKTVLINRALEVYALIVELTNCGPLRLVDDAGQMKMLYIV